MELRNRIALCEVGSDHFSTLVSDGLSFHHDLILSSFLDLREVGFDSRAKLLVHWLVIDYARAPFHYIRSRH